MGQTEFSHFLKSMRGKQIRDERVKIKKKKSTQPRKAVVYNRT